MRVLFLWLASLACGVCLTSRAAHADPPPQAVAITITDKGCQPMSLTVPSAKVAFKIRNESRRAVEWEILKGGIVVEERENILPSFTSTVTAKLEPGDYEMTCGLLSNPRGKLSVGGDADNKAEAKPRDFDAIIKDYKAFVAEDVDRLVEKSTIFVAAIKSGKLKEAQEAYAPARVYYERIEPVAEVFADLDKSMDARADDYEKKEMDPAFSGFHRLEYGLFEKKSTDGLADHADRLMKDVNDLKGRVANLDITPKILVGGAAALIEEVAAKKMSGEEDRYAKTDLSDFQANVDGAQKIVSLLRPELQSRDPVLLKRIDTNFAKVDNGLSKYRSSEGTFESYDALKPEDHRALKGPITLLAEDLSRLRGTLGVD